MKRIIFRALVSVFLLSVILNIFGTDVLADKKKYTTWEGVAADMAIAFDGAIEDIRAGKGREAYKHMNDAYFGHYEIQGFEKNVMVYISKNRVNHIEALFGNIKHSALGNIEADTDSIVKKIESLKVKVYRDAMVLDGKAGKKSPDKVGEKVYGGKAVPERDMSLEWVDGTPPKAGEDVTVTAPAAEDAKPDDSMDKPRDVRWSSFLVSFGLLVREGLEAILVIVAIIAYLVKTGNKHLCKSVYIGAGAAVIASILLALFIELILGGSGVAQELIEGWTMLLAVVVLFYVSNWMLMKADSKDWSAYIEGKVTQSIDAKSQRTLIFAAFLAVIREGAELILFYKASFSAGMNDVPFTIYGMLAGIVVLVVVYIAFRYFSVKLPLKPFFMFTSILLFLMCISFMGKGIFELTEADVIMGRTVIPAMHGFTIDWLNIYDRAETLVPQIMLVIAFVWILLSRRGKSKEAQKHIEAEASRGAADGAEQRD